MMKTDKIRILMAALAVLSVASCQKEGLRTLTATFEQFDNGSKAYIDDDYYACWEDDDAVAVNGTPCAVTLTTGSGHANSAEITIPGTLDGEDLLAFYPAGRISDMSATGGTVDFPHIQTYRENSDGRQIIDNPMAAYCPSDGEVLKFRNLGSLLKVTIPNNANIKAIQVKGIDNQMLCGKAQIRFDNNGDPSLSPCTDGFNSVTLRFPTPVRANGKSFYIVLPSNTNFETLTIAVLAKDGTTWATHAKTTLMDRVLARNHIAAISYDLSHHEDYDFVADWTIRYTAETQVEPRWDDGWGTYSASVAAYSFSGSKGQIVFNDIITGVADDTFEGASLQSIDLPVSVTTIGAFAFYYCYNLTAIDMPAVTTVEDSAFFACLSLTTVSLPHATTIENEAFINCFDLDTVLMPNVTTIGKQAFMYCSVLNMVSMPNVTTIDVGAFRFCSNLRSVSLPLATTIGQEAFWECSRLLSIKLPNVTTIGTKAFYNCESLSHLYTKTKIPTIGEDAFFNVPESAILHRPSTMGGGSWIAWAEWPGGYAFDYDD